MPNPIVKTVACTGCNSYLVGCPETREALLVDPKVGQEAQYADLLERFDFRLAAVADTHTHADHLSASSRYLDRGVELWMSARTGVQRSKRGLEHGERLRVGAIELEVREVPGHTADSVAFVGPGFVLTGDSLFIGGLARADFHGSDPAQLFGSVRERLLDLPDDTLVFPGHGYDDLLFSTIGHERAHNPALQFSDGAAYAASLETSEGAGNSPAVDENLRLNLEASPELPESPSTAATCCAAPTAGAERSAIPEADPADDRGALLDAAAAASWVDVREPWEYAQGHISGTRSLPLSELGFRLGEVRSHEPLTISCRSGVRSMTAARTLERLGVAGAPVNVRGGILRWQELGLPIEGSPVA